MPAPAPDDASSQLTVVLIPLVGGDALTRLERSIAALGVRHIVVDRCGGCIDGLGHVLKGGADRRAVPVRRRLGAEAANTPFVAFLEDTVVPAETWLDDLLSAFAPADVAAVGGPVMVAERLPARCRALGLTEYGKYHAKFGGSDGSVATLPGANFAFRTAPLLAAMPEPQDALIDNEVFNRLTSHGYRLAFAPSMAVEYAEPHGEGARLSTRFNHGRLYASGACRGRGVPFRAMFVLKSLALPFVLTARQLRQVSPALRTGLAVVAWVLAFNLWWSAGELVGAAAGGARGGLDQWQ